MELWAEVGVFVSDVEELIYAVMLDWTTLLSDVVVVCDMLGVFPIMFAWDEDDSGLLLSPLVGMDVELLGLVDVEVEAWEAGLGSELRGLPRFAVLVVA